MQPSVGLIIAGSDCSGAAGMQADIKTFTSLQVYPTTVFTCLTAQNGQQWYLDEAVNSKMILAQLDAICSHYAIKYVKLGMLYNLEIMQLISDYFTKHNQYRLIVDPVMACKNNDHLPSYDIAQFYSQHLIRQGYITTPNVREAEFMLRIKITNQADLIKAAQQLYDQTQTPVLMKGGHLQTNETITDIFYDGVNLQTWEHPLLKNDFINGAGCTLASALTCYLIRGKSLMEASEAALHYVHLTIKHGVKITAGVNPVNQSIFCSVQPK